MQFIRRMQFIRLTVGLRQSSPPTPVVAKLARALPWSLGLLAIALALAILVGLPLGIVAGLRRRTRFSGLLVFLSILGTSTPSYLAAMLLIWSGAWLWRVTGADLLPVRGFGWDAHVILPALVLAVRPAAHVMWLGYTTVAELMDAGPRCAPVADADELGSRTARLHILRNARVPLLTTVAVSLRFSLAILPIVEFIFNWPGVGQELLVAIQGQDATAVVGMILPLVLLLIPFPPPAGGSWRGCMDLQLWMREAIAHEASDFLATPDSSGAGSFLRPRFDPGRSLPADRRRRTGDSPP
jgi:ABC-type dipeptide/oligopeptide/nickel transport system permease component